MTMFEGIPVFPKSLVVDSKGNIFLLDTFNNRIQKFDKEGKYIASISVESYRRSTKQEVEESKNTWNKLGFDFPTIYAQELYIDSGNNLYLEQEKKT
jgi:formylmethanofuran dehydrogenase subunit E-like metal-binding protein